jgi:hypothetical protein
MMLMISVMKEELNHSIIHFIALREADRLSVPSLQAGANRQILSMRCVPALPIQCRCAVHPLFLEAAFQMSEEPDRHQFLVSKEHSSIVAQALITSLWRSIVDLADKQVDLNQ